MVFNSTADRNGIIQTIERKTDLGLGYISGDSTRLADFTAMINLESHRVWHTIFMATGNWQYDDGNQTDLPQATTDLVSATATYAIPSTALTIQRIEVKDSSGLFYELTPITKEEIPGAVDEFHKTDGQPNFYRILNGTIELFPASNYNSTAGLKVYFDRDSVDFVVGDTTKAPGFASPYHEILPIMASIEWLKVKQPQSLTLPQLQTDELKLEDAIKKFYAKRFKNFIPRISRARETFK